MARAPEGGEVLALAVDPEAALLEYLEMFYNLRRAGSALTDRRDRLRHHDRPRRARRPAHRQGGRGRPAQAARAVASSTPW